MKGAHRCDLAKSRDVIGVTSRPNSFLHSSLFALLGLELPDVKLELFAFEDVTVGATDLTRTRGDGGEDASSLELFFQQRINLGSLFAVVVFLLSLLGTLLVEKRFVSLSQFHALLPSKGQGIMRLVPLTERRGVNGDDGVLDESLGPHQLVIAGVVDGVDDTRLAGDRFRTPREVSSVQSESSPLDISASDTDQMNAISADFGHGRGASQFILSLLLVSRPLASSLPLLVPLCLRNTHLFVSIPKF